MKFLQKLGKSLMLPVACLPVCGILMGIGYILAPAFMGVPGVEASGFVYSVGVVCIKAGGALIDNMAWLFALGVAIGMSDDGEGTSGLAGLVSFLVITTVLSSTSVAAFTGEPVNPAFDKIQNQFIGILAGIIGATCYNKFKGTKLLDAFSFFSGKRCVAIITAVSSLVICIILFFVWPIIYGGLVSLGKGIVSMGTVGAGIYVFLNRLLIPFGLHHALNSVFWFDVAGINDLGNFWGNAGTFGETGIYMTGFFPFMMFGLPAACLAMYHTSKDSNKKNVAGLLASSAFCSFFTGVTEPIEFSFMFLAPMLYFVHAILAGVTAAITVMFPIRSGFCFSGGAIDLVLSSGLPLAQNPFFILGIGAIVGGIYYMVFRVVIKKLNLKTPGREDEDVEMEKKVTFSNENFVKAATIILEGLGGKENIISIDNCITRLRIEVKEQAFINEDKIKSAGVSGIIRPGKTSVQIIVGTKVQFVADEFKNLCK